MSCEPPLHPVTFAVPDQNGAVSDQVFERAYLYRFIATPGVGRSFRNVRHPLMSAWITRANAIEYVCEVPASVCERMHQERRRLNLTMFEVHPYIIDDDDRQLMETTIARTRSR